MEINTKKETSELINSFENEKSKGEVKDAILDNPAQDLGFEVGSFFKSRLDKIRQDEEFKSSLKKYLMTKIEKGEASFSEVSRTLASMEEQTSIASESVLSLLRPSAGSNNPLLSALSKKADATNALSDKEFSSEDQRKIDIIYRFFQKFEEQEKK